MKKLSIDFLLNSKAPASQIVSVRSTDPVQTAAELMTKYKVGLVIVVDDEKLVGVISERDIVRKWVCGQKFPQSVPVSELMTPNVEVVSPEDTVFDCYLRFIARNCRHLPVIDSFGQVLGVLSMRDVTGYMVNRLEEQGE